MSGWDLFVSAFVVALAALSAWYLWTLLLAPALRFLLEAGRAWLARSERFTALSPTLAAQRFIAGGCSPEQGMPTLRELQWLLSLTAAQRFGWAQNVVHALEDGLGAGKTAEYTEVLDDLGLTIDTPMLRPPVKLYLETVAQGFPIVGCWRWTRS